MNSLNNLWVVSLDLSDVGGCRLEVLFHLLEDHFEILGVERERVVERMLGLLAGLEHHHGDLVDEVDLLHQHTGDPWPDQPHVLEVHVKPDCLHAEMTTQYLEIVQMLRDVVIDNLATV